jgi:hypothetical protein
MTRFARIWFKVKGGDTRHKADSSAPLPAFCILILKVLQSTVRLPRPLRVLLQEGMARAACAGGGETTRSKCFRNGLRGSGLDAMPRDASRDQIIVVLWRTRWFGPPAMNHVSRSSLAVVSRPHN